MLMDMLYILKEWRSEDIEIKIKDVEEVLSIGRYVPLWKNWLI